MANVLMCVDQFPWLGVITCAVVVVQISTEVTLEAVCKAFARARGLRQVTCNVMCAAAAGVVIESGTGVVTLCADTGNALNRRITMAGRTITGRLEGIGGRIVLVT